MPVSYTHLDVYKRQASVLLLYRAANARPLFRTSSTIGSFFIIITSEFFGRAENGTHPTIGFNNAGDECFCFGIIDMLEVSCQWKVDSLFSRDGNVQSIPDTTAWNGF